MATGRHAARRSAGARRSRAVERALGRRSAALDGGLRQRRNGHQRRTAEPGPRRAAAVVGAERAVDAARDALAPDALAAVVLLLRRPGLAPDARRVVRGRPDLVADLQHRLLS